MKLEASWYARLKEEIGLPYVGDLKRFLEEEGRSGYKVYPPESLVFHAFLQTPFDKVKVVIVGQDPYHGERQAHGLSFSVPDGVAVPPSLQNVFKELKDDLGIAVRKGGCLESWAKEGVLLLNATLTVRAKNPKSHYGKGWERFTDAVIRSLLQKEEPIVFLLWGKSAQEKCAHILEGAGKTSHLVLCAAHPSPYSAYNGFFGCRHFSQANAFLEKHGRTPIDWGA